MAQLPGSNETGSPARSRSGARSGTGPGELGVPPSQLPHARRLWLAVVAAGVIGLVGGVATFLAEGLIDSPVWVGIFHSLTLWAMITIGVGANLRNQWRLAALAGLVTQIGLVTSYYSAKSVLAGHPLSVASLVIYSLVAVFAGPLCGAAGACLRDRRLLIRVLSLGVASAPWIADGVRGIMGTVATGLNVEAKMVEGVCFIAVGLFLPLVISHSLRDWLRSLVVAAGLVGLVVLVDLLR
ncbi:DUF6518 family protein [Kutzneria viridogrisea]